MAIFKMVVAISLLCLAAGDDGIIPPGPPNGSNSTTSSTTSTSAPTVNPTSATTTTTASPTTTTQKPPDTTTTATTSTSTTTAKPNSTTTSATTPKPTPTTPPPSPKPTPPAPVNPVQGKWVVNYTDTNNTCLVLQAAIQLDLPYKDGNATKTYKVNVPPTAKAFGNCTADVENITLIFNETDAVSFSFRKSNDSKTFDLASIIVAINETIVNGSQSVVLVHTKDEFATPLSRSYKCVKEQTLNLTSVLPENFVGQLRLSHVQMQAFRNATNQKFDEAVDCAGSETPDVVPIAVGCALAALVIIVLIAYLVGRRRSQARGYLSM